MLKRSFPVFLAVSLLVVAVFFAVQNGQESEYPELARIASHSGDFSELQNYLKVIAEKKGALYAFEILRRAPLPPQTDVHLLGHVVGDELYKQYGKEAIQYCTDEFRNACSHTVVVGMLLDFGSPALDDISETCKKAPGGVGAYTMCFHGLGHGVLAYTGYDLEKTVELCRKTGTKEFYNQEFAQCVGGAVMEGISGGGHDRKAWAEARPRFFNKEDPLSPCNLSFMPEEVRSYCYVYLTPHLIEVAGGDMNHPDPKVFPLAFSYCSALPENDRQKEICINSFGKEFVGWARMSDGRDIAALTDSELALMTSWCAMTGNERDAYYCLQGIQRYIYWGGENDPKQSVRYCTFLGVKKQETGGKCFSDLASLVALYVKDTAEYENICSMFPESKREECISAKSRAPQSRAI